MTPYAFESGGLPDAAGWLGLLIYIGAYLALQLGFIRGDGYLFPALNLLGALAILFSLMEAFNIHAAIGEVAWVVISVVGILRLWFVSRFIRLDPREARAAAALAPTLAADQARALLRLGAWRVAPPGETLTVEGAPVAALAYIEAGRAVVKHGGVVVAVLGPGSVIGEMTYLSGAPATATVVAETPLEALLIDAETLRRFLRRNHEIANAMELAAATALREKLAQTNRRNARRDDVVPPPDASGRPLA